MIRFVPAPDVAECSEPMCIRPVYAEGLCKIHRDMRDYRDGRLSDPVHAEATVPVELGGRTFRVRGPRARATSEPTHPDIIV